MDVRINESWRKILKEEIDKPYFVELVNFLHLERESGKTIYPPDSMIFSAFEFTPFDQVKVVIIGQDPYHGLGKAHGLSFSVPEGIKPPPSLMNIYKELKTDIGIETNQRNGSLIDWAQQGVFLLNTVLTVRAGEPASHSKIGWTKFTDAVIESISNYSENIIFLLWGNYAKRKKALIDPSKHHILEAPHPSPLARGGFFGCKHFSMTNQILTSKGKEAIKW